MKRLSYPLVRLPEKTDLILYLINEELKSTYFFNGLCEVGIDDVWFQVHLASPILRMVGFKDVSDELLEFYLNLIDRASKKIDSDRDSVTKQSIKVYTKLAAEKKRFENSN